MPDFTPKEKITGTFTGDGGPLEVKFNKVWGGHTFTDDEAKSLLAGDVIEFDAHSARTDKDYTAKGQLEKQEYNGHEFWGFKPDFG